MMSAADRKAAEASSHRRMRSVTNPDEPLASPPPSYAPTFDTQPLMVVKASTPVDPLDTTRPGSSGSSSQHALHASQSSSSQSSVPQKRSLSPFPTPPNSSEPSSPLPVGRRPDAHTSAVSVENPPPPYIEELRRSMTPPEASGSSSMQQHRPPALASAPQRVGTPELTPPPITPQRSTYGSPDGTPRRVPRMRPAPPQGPRKPSYGPAAARMRAGSVSGQSASGAGGSPASRKVSMVSHAAPKFQPQGVPWRGLTMEAAQWTLTSQQLQHIVSTAIRNSADASMIRILPLDTLERDLPEELARVATYVEELKRRYKLGVRRRNTLLATVGRLAEGAATGGPDGVAEVQRALAELNEASEALDSAAEELYTATDQLAQLERLRDVHQRSALAMALRKLNSSFLKQVGEVQRLRDQVAVLEAERDEAWHEAQEVAQEFDDFTDRIVAEPSPATAGSSSKGGRDADKESLTPSRRSSRVLVARKNSQRASKAGLRSMYRRSHRSSTSSNYRYSGVASPGVWSGVNGDEEIPPVPALPSRRDLLFFGPGRNSMGPMSTGKCPRLDLLLVDGIAD